MSKALAAVFLVGLRLFFAAPSSQGQAKASSAHKASPDEILAKPVEWGKVTVRLFKDDERRINFSLTTSWIPGEGHKGMFRYRTAAVMQTPTFVQAAKSPNAYAPDGIEKLMRRSHSCDIFFVLNDADGFVLRKVLVPLGFGMDTEGHIGSLYVNDSTQMDAAEYRSFIGKPDASGTWG